MPTPWDYGEALSTLLAVGWGGAEVTGLVAGSTVREVGDAIRALLSTRAKALALNLLEGWERQGRVFRI